MTFRAGQEIRVSEINAIIPILGYVTTDQTKTSNTTLADVTGLAVTVEADKLYALDGYIAYTAGATGDLKMAITVPASTTGHWGLYPLVVGSSASAGDILGQRIDAFGDANTQVAGGSNSFSGALLCLPRGFIDTAGTAGTVQFRFAQNTSNATSTIIETGSWLRITELA